MVGYSSGHRTSLRSLTSDQNSLVSSHRSSLATISYSMLNVSSLYARNKILAAPLNLRVDKSSVDIRFGVYKRSSNRSYKYFILRKYGFNTFIIKVGTYLVVS